MTSEQLEAARQEFTRLLGTLQPPLSAAEIAVRVDRIMLQFNDRATVGLDIAKPS